MSRRLEKSASGSLLDSGALNQSLLLLGQIGEAGNLGVLKGASFSVASTRINIDFGFGAGFAGVVHL